MADFVAANMTTQDVATLLTAFATIGQDVAARGLQGKAVISCSLSANETAITDLGIARFRRVLGVLNSLDVPVVLSAGNYGGDINTYPALLADEFPLITVGAVDQEGEIASWSQGGPLLTTAAGGVGIVCATNETSTAYRAKQGTDFCEYIDHDRTSKAVIQQDQHADHFPHPPKQPRHSSPAWWPTGSATQTTRAHSRPRR